MATFSRKGYQEIAKVLEYELAVIPPGCDEGSRSGTIRNIVLSLIEVFQADNQVFDADRFRKAIFGSASKEGK